MPALRATHLGARHPTRSSAGAARAAVRPIRSVRGNIPYRIWSSGSVLKPLFGLIRRNWHMPPLGLSFGLGFETATEVSVMGLSASQASSGAPLAVALVFPTLFAVGMTLVDATDGILMMRVYQWAFVDPRRKLYYNCIITLVSALIAILISGIEVADLVVDNFGFSGALSLVADLAGHFNLLGAVIVAVFIGSWLASMASSRARRTTETVLPIES